MPSIIFCNFWCRLARLSASGTSVPASDFGKLALHGFVLAIVVPDKSYTEKNFICSQADVIDKHGDILRVILKTPLSAINSSADNRHMFKSKFPIHQYILMTGLAPTPDKFAASDTYAVGYSDSIFTTADIKKFAPDLVPFHPIQVSAQYAHTMETLKENGGMHIADCILRLQLHLSYIVQILCE